MMLCVYGSPLYQWDVNRQLQINPERIVGNATVHCCHKGDASTLVVVPYVVGEMTLVNIPNILLQKSGTIRVYIVCDGDTVFDTALYVVSRPRPDDYVYTETEVLTYASLEKRVSELEKGGTGGVYFETDESLKLENGVLSVNTTNDMEVDNTLPITSAGVYATVGNIEVLLKTI